MKLLITDLDNTLYDWVTFYSQSFQAMVDQLANQINTPLEDILAEYKSIHQKFGNSEKPFATLELPSVISYYGTNDKNELKELLSNVLKAFNVKRNETLRLYPGVAETLKKLSDSGVTIVGHTEALEFNSLHRLDKLGIQKHFKHLYTLEDKFNTHPDPKSAKVIDVTEDFVIRLPSSESKPNPKLLEHICRKEGIDVEEALYVGDSLTKDISMAKEIGMKSAWANYGRKFDPKCWDLLVKITHWTNDDVVREEELKKAYSNVKPDYTIESFSEIANFS